MTRATVVVGAQWGDEGKGKITDVLANDANAVIRYSGGPNAGHTLCIDGQNTVLHLLPSALLRTNIINMVGPGVVCDPEVLSAELAIAREANTLKSVYLDRYAPMILPIHKELDRARETASGRSAIGTTLRGIGPCYEDFVARRGPTLGDLADPKKIRLALNDRRFYMERSLLVQAAGVVPPTKDQLLEWCMRYARDIVPRLADTREIVSRLAQRGARLLFEGAQGIMLDVFNGTRPYCTSSICSAACISASLGVHHFERVVGISKAYTTRVGGGPFPSEILDDLADTLREKGHEYGATTGRPRRLGWLDLPALRYACRMGGITELVISKLDVLTGLQKIMLVVGYDTATQEVDEHRTLDAELMSNISVRCTEMPGWQESIDDCRCFDELPWQAQQYIRAVEEYTGKRVSGVGIGPDREAIIWRD